MSSVADISGISSSFVIDVRGREVKRISLQKGIELCLAALEETDSDPVAAEKRILQSFRKIIKMGR